MPSAGLALEFTRQYTNSITSRNTFGPLGYGWTDNWNYSLAVGSDGTVTVTMPSGQERIFQPDSRYTDVYFSQPGDTGTLAAIPSSTPGGAPSFVLQEADGTEEYFNSNGTLGYIQDSQGDRITAGYTGRPAHEPDVILGRLAHDRVQLGRTHQLGNELGRPDRHLRLRLPRITTSPP